MIKKFALALLLFLFCTNGVFAQDRYVTYKSASWVLEGGTTDTLRVLIGKGRRNVAIDTLGNVIKPSVIASYNGFCRVNLSLTNTNGTVDSVSLHSTPLSSSGAVSTNDSTFVIGTATTGAAIGSSDDYTITTKPSSGIGLVFESYDQTTDTARVTIEVWYTQ